MQRVVVSTAISVGGVLYARNIYYKDQVGYIASTKQATLTSSTLFNALNINASGGITGANLYSDGIVVASTVNTGVIRTGNALATCTNSLGVRDVSVS